MTSSTHDPSPAPTHDPSISSSVHQSLGGGSVADLLLWRNPKNSGLLLLGSTSMWFLFERAGYSLVSLFSNALLLLVAILFLWAKSAAILNRPLPPLPNLEVSDASIEKVADASVARINCVLQVARDITFKGDVKLFLKVASALLMFSYVGSIFNFFTIVYIVVVVSLAIPILYENRQDDVDKKLSLAHRFISEQLKKIDEKLHKVEIPERKTKKMQ